MKYVKMKCIKISTDGSTYFSYLNLQSAKPIIFYEKDSRTLMFSKKIGKKQSQQNLRQNLYKFKYKP